MTNTQDSDPALGLHRALGILRRRFLLIAFCVVLVAGSAYAASKSRTKHYTATASLVFDNNQLNQQVAGLSVANSSTQQSQESTNVKLVELGETARRTAKLLGGGVTEQQVRGNLSVGAQGESNIVDVSATATSPTLAAEIANTYVRQFVAGQQSANHSYFSSALALVNKQLAALSPGQRIGPQGLALQDRAQSLGILAELQSGNVQVAQAATIPTSPSSPKVAWNTVLAAFLGLLLGLGLAFLLERLDRHIKEPEDLERIFKLPLLGVVPESSAYQLHASGGGPDAGLLPSGEAEAFRMLRARLRYFNVDRDLRVILVTSASAGDGKSMVVQNLAETAASTGSRVLVIESDLRRPTLGSRLGLRPAPGLAEVLISTSTIERAIQTTAVVSPNGGSAASGSAVSVLTAGAPPPNPTELIESQAMEHVLEWAGQNYDLVLLDTSPFSVVPDVIPLLRQSDGVVIVSRLGKSTRDGEARMREELARLGAPMLGVVANGFKARDAIGYGYDYAPENYAPNGEVVDEIKVAKVETPRR
jgi:capsular exopolysaccharide synthesis family protein